MADRHQLPRPVIGSGARFDPDQAWPYRLEEAQHLTSSQLPPHDDRAVCGDTVNLENSLRQIEPDDSDGLHGTAPRRDVPDDDTARTVSQVEVVHTITSQLAQPGDPSMETLPRRQALKSPTIAPKDLLRSRGL